jgi:hypothetical protein
MKDKDIQSALEKINDDLIELYAEIFADSVMDSKLDARRANLRCAINGAIIKLQWAEDEIN